MIQRGQNPGFTLEPRNAIRVLSKGLWKNLDGDAAAQLPVCRLIHVAHAAGAEVTCDLVVCELGSDHDAQ